MRRVVEPTEKAKRALEGMLIRFEGKSVSRKDAKALRTAGEKKLRNLGEKQI